MAERPVKFCLHLQDQPGNTICSIDIIEICQEQLPPNSVQLIETILKKVDGCFCDTDKTTD